MKITNAMTMTAINDAKANFAERWRKEADELSRAGIHFLLIDTPYGSRYRRQLTGVLVGKQISSHQHGFDQIVMPIKVLAETLHGFLDTAVCHHHLPR